MERLERYKNIKRTMTGVKVQILDSLDYTDKFLPTIPKYDIVMLWKTLKPIVRYRNDPKDRELLQSVPTLFSNNFHGIPGAGDCDCFTILTTTACIVLNFPCKICLVGRSHKEPVHIYNKIWDGKYYVPFDMTNNQVGKERYYPIKQEIYVDI